MIEQKTMRLISYGLGNEYRPELWKPVQNRDHNKPKGGLWASPVGCEWGWKEWCEAEDWGDLSTSFEFEFTGQTLVINSQKEAEAMPWRSLGWATSLSQFRYQFPDFEHMAREGIEAIHLTDRGQEETRFSMLGYGLGLYGWDCESVLVMRREGIRVSCPRKEES